MSNKIRQAVISAGGFGSRLKALTGETPKPLFPFCGLPIIEHAIAELTGQGITNIVLLLHHKASSFTEAIPKLEAKYSAQITFYIEQSPNGEASAIWYVKDLLDEHFIFLGGDIVFKMSIERLTRFYFDTQADAMLVAHRSSHPGDSDLIAETYGSRIQAYKLKNEPNKGNISMFLGNSGIYVLRRESILCLPEPSVDVKPNLFQHLMRFLDTINIYSYNTTEYIHDVGTPKRFKQSEEDFESGLIDTLSYNNKQKALFLDRDNTLIRCPPGQYVNHISDIQILSSNLDIIKDHTRDHQIIWIVSNQPQISMGHVLIDDVFSINSYLITELLTHDILVDGFSICPHHPHQGFQGELSLLKHACFCRKPRVGLFAEQIELRNIDITNSLMIGDSSADEESAERLGCDFIKV